MPSINHEAVIKKLKNQVRLLKQREAEASRKLQAALKQAAKVGRGYEDRLTSKVRVLKSKVAATQAATYLKVAADLERQLLKNIEQKARAVAAAATMIEKKFAVKLARGIAKKGRVTARTTRKKARRVSAKRATRK